MISIPVSAEEVIVDDNGAADYTSIQEAINNCLPGDTIIVNSGTYQENLDVDVENLTILSKSGPEYTYIQALDSSDHVFDVTAHFVTINGFDISGANAPSKHGIYLNESEKCNVENNRLSNNYGGIYLYLSSNSMLKNNTALNNYYSIRLDNSNNNALINNTASNNQFGIGLTYSSNNALSNNIVSNNLFGIDLFYSGYNTLSTNFMLGNSYNFKVWGSSEKDYLNDISTNNLADGKPIYYLVNVSDIFLDSSSNAGAIYCVDCTNISIKDLNLKNNEVGICFFNTQNSIVENYTASYNNYGVSLSYSSNNSLINNTASNNDCGISLENSNNNELINNIALDNTSGIFLSHSKYNTLSNNTANSNNYCGIRLAYSSNNMLKNNTANSNNYWGIKLESSSNNTLSTNTVLNNRFGIDLYSSGSNTLSNNTVNSNKDSGISLQDSSNNTFFDNEADSNSGSGIYLSSSSNYNTLSNNTANSNSLIGIYVYSSSNYNALTNNIALNNGCGIRMYSSSNNTLSNNKANSNGRGIELWYLNNYNTLSNNTANSNKDYGIFLDSSSNNTLNDNVVNSNAYNGIECWSSNYNKISNNKVNSNKGYGINLVFSNKSSLKNNIALNNPYGISLSSSVNNVLDNNIVSNSSYGIRLDGIGSSNNMLSNNIASNNSYGIFLYSSNSTLENNIVLNNTCGVYLFSPNNISFLNNYFSNSNNIEFDGTSTDNLWNTTKTAGINIIGGEYLGGNYWAKPDGTGFSQTHYDTDGDSICEEFYDLGGGNIDYLPLTDEQFSDITPPASVSNLDDEAVEEHWINWTWINPSDPDFNHIEIYLNGVLLTNTSTEFYNATSLQPETSYTISTHTVDTSGNINGTWVNLTTATKKEQIEPIIVEAGNDQIVDEGNSVDFEGSFMASGPYVYSYHWSFGDGSEEDSSLTTSHVYADNGTYTVNLTVTEEKGNFGNDTLTVTVNNVAPYVGEIDSPIDPIKIGVPITVNSTFTDAGTLDTHTAVWDWADPLISDGIVTETDGSGTVNGTHTYFSAGVYKVNLTVTDDDGGSNYSVSKYVVIYDPEGGFVTGGGWINSPEEAYTPDPTLTGTANFGFVSKYKKGATVPTGVTQFNFQVADLNFHSDTYDWLVIAGARAQYKGMGKINGEGEYGFMLTAIDGQLSGGGGSDKFRIKIWDKVSEAIVYDNMVGAEDNADPTTVIQGGSITIHQEK